MQYRVDVVDWRGPHAPGSFRKCASRKFANLAHARHYATKAAQRYAARYYVDEAAQATCAALNRSIIEQENWGATAGSAYNAFCGYRTATIYTA